MGFKPKIKQKRWKGRKERDIIDFWVRNEVFKYQIDLDKPNYIIDTPPPYVSGRAHLGFAVHYAQIDMIARYYRMMGHNVIFPGCTDRNGLPIEVKVEQKLGKSMHEMDREEFLQICRKELDEAEENTIQVMKWMGLSCNTFYGSPEIYYQTDSPQYRYNTQRTFCRAWYEDLIFSDSRPNNWCIDCGTTIADAEIEYRRDHSHLHQIKFQIEASDESIIIATTRPELIATCELVIYHPSDTRYSHLEGKNTITPIFNKVVPIRKHTEADPEYGTGIMMICAYGDKSDVKILREFNIVNPQTMIEPNGQVNEVAGKYQGLTIKEAQEAIVEDLKKEGILIDSEETLRRVPICWRSKTPIEIIAMNEYYMKQLEMIDDLKIISDQMEFYPRSSKIILDNWLNALNMDWAISRRRFYGTSIPIWYCSKCNSPNVPKENELDRYYEAWKENSPVTTCSHCGNSLESAIGEARTFDTWFDSSISELIACNFGNIFFESEKEKFFETNFPCSIRPQAKDIVRTWLYYTILRSYHLFKSPPFKQVWISGLILDPYGGKMSKSTGNSVDPLIFLQPWDIPEDTPETLKPERNSWKTIAEKETTAKFLSKNGKSHLYYGADSVRLTSCLQGSHGSDIRFSLSKLDGNAKFITKLWNIARFISCFPAEASPESLFPTDQWILTSLDALVQRCSAGYAQLDFSIPSENIYNWVWNIFAPHYIELIKSRAYRQDETTRNEAQSARYCLHHILQNILKLLAPITPFITESIYQSLYKPTKSIHQELLPKPIQNKSDEDPRTLELIKLNSFIWKTKKDRGLSLKAPLKKVYVPKILEEFIPDLREMHNIETVFTIKPDTNEEDIIYKDSFAIRF
ncbi:MAG: valine--tRNA ligase [Candidatus Heimdallarchaeota archaeon]|nr:MAG: valine--tRNA ligase [Candidatus Heimdallarchaeota archaeon]